MNEEQEDAVRELMRVPGLGKTTAETLVGSGYLSIEEVAYAPQEELLRQSGLVESQALAVRASARNFLLTGSRS